MSYVEVLFSRRHSITTPLLRAFAWSSWSHVALRDESSVIEAVGFEGVRDISFTQAIAAASRWELVRLPCADPAAAIAAARSQIGKPYDWLGVAGIGLRRDWRDESRWYCSELVAWAIEQGGTRLFRPVRINRVTQEHLYMLAPA